MSNITKNTTARLGNTTGGSPSGTTPPWTWEESRWRGIVDRVRAGRSLRPRQWQDGARVAVPLSFDSDHESGELRAGVGSRSKGPKASVPLTNVALSFSPDFCRTCVGM